MIPQIRVHFTLTGKNVDPAEITKKLGVEPTTTWRMGECVPKTAVKWKHDGWRVSTNEVETVDMPVLVRAVLKKMIPAADKIRSVCSERGLDAELNCIAYVDDQIPIVHFDPDIVTAVSDLGAEIDVDIMLVSDGDED